VTLRTQRKSDTKGTKKAMPIARSLQARNDKATFYRGGMTSRGAEIDLEQPGTAIRTYLRR